MPKINYLLIIVVFVAGVAVGMYICQYSGSTPAPLDNIPAAQANTLYLNYVAHAHPLNDTLEAIMIDRDQYSAMHQLDEINHPPSGFRIYNGLRGTNDTIGIMVGVNEGGNDIINKIVLTTKLHPCPTICDISAINRRPTPPQ